MVWPAGIGFTSASWIAYRTLNGVMRRLRLARIEPARRQRDVERVRHLTGRAGRLRVARPAPSAPRLREGEPRRRAAG